jgi:NADP-dependent 3-hydroxy acid dehydrogenase YdfG
MTLNIEGKVVVITGASSGLGEAAARLLSASGARLVLGARRIERSTRWQHTETPYGAGNADAASSNSRSTTGRLAPRRRPLLPAPS